LLLDTWRIQQRPPQGLAHKRGRDLRPTAAVGGVLGGPPPLLGLAARPIARCCCGSDGSAQRGAGVASPASSPARRCAGSPAHRGREAPAGRASFGSDVWADAAWPGSSGPCVSCCASRGGGGARRRQCGGRGAVRGHAEAAARAAPPTRWQRRRGQGRSGSRVVGRRRAGSPWRRRRGARGKGRRRGQRRATSRGLDVRQLRRQPMLGSHFLVLSVRGAPPWRSAPGRPAARQWRWPCTRGERTQPRRARRRGARRSWRGRQRPHAVGVCGQSCCGASGRAHVPQARQQPGGASGCPVRAAGTQTAPAESRRGGCSVRRNGDGGSGRARR
jgi:hypothetical protein